MEYEQQAEMNISCLEVPVEEAAGAFGVIVVDEQGRVQTFQEKPPQLTPIPGNDTLCVVSMGNYVFNTEFLCDQLIQDADDPDSKHDFGHSIIPSCIREGHRLYAYPFRDPATGKQAHWRDVGTVDAYWLAHMELTEVLPQLDLYDKTWPILTHQAQPLHPSRLQGAGCRARPVPDRGPALRTPRPPWPTSSALPTPSPKSASAPAAQGPA